MPLPLQHSNLKFGRKMLMDDDDADDVVVVVVVVVVYKCCVRAFTKREKNFKIEMKNCFGG